MRFIVSAFSALLVLLVTACASTSPDAGGDSQSTASTFPFSRSSAAKSAADKPIVDVDRNSVNSLADGSGDLWQRIRQGFQMPDLNNDLVQAQIAWYAARPDYVQRMAERSKLYLHHITEELEARHMPTELALLPFIESGYNPQALSIAKAAGMWQFIPGTGRTYNLKQNMFQDQRRDVLASTNAALDYLSKLYQMFGDWYLALAAYNSGEGRVQRAIERNKAAGLPTDYQSLRLPNETRNYVPKLQAVKNIVANPQMYNLALPEIPNHPYFVIVTTARDMDVRVAAQLADLPLKEFKALNPSFKKPVILGATNPQILLPFENARTFESNLKSYDGSLSSWTTYRVNRTTRPAALAAKIGVNPATLITVNKIPAGTRLKPGSTLLVPKVGNTAVADISAAIAEGAILAVEPDVPPTRKMFVKVQRRDKLATVAKRYRVSVAQIRGWNKIRDTRLVPGQVLVLHVSTNRPLGRQPLRTAVASSARQKKVFRKVSVSARQVKARQATKNHRSKAAQPPSRARGTAVKSTAGKVKPASL